MRLNILFGGSAGQGINKISAVVSNVLSKKGYYTFNYRDYSSLIRGGHNFNVLSISDKKVGSTESILDGIVVLDGNTFKIHEKELKKGGFILSYENFNGLGINLNVALAGALMKVLGIEKRYFISSILKYFGKGAVEAAEKGYHMESIKFNLKKLKNKVSIMDGSGAIALGALNSGMNIHISYPMTPSTKVGDYLVRQRRVTVFQSESELSAINSALGASFAGARTMVSTSGGGFDLMSEGISLQGISEIPLVIYLASRPGPGTGIPTYTAQSDLDIALRSGHGEFPRVVIAPGDPFEGIEKTNEAFYLAEKFNTLSIILSDKHLAESEFSFDKTPKKPLKIKISRDVPGRKIVRANGYEHDAFGNTTESPQISVENALKRIEKYKQIGKECKKFEMIKIHGSKKSKNLIIGWGSTKTAILDAIKGLDFKFLQVLYLKPLSSKIKEEIMNADKVILIECNVTGQLGRLLREKTGISIKNKILKYDGRPFQSDELRKEILKIK